MDAHALLAEPPFIKRRFRRLRQHSRGSIIKPYFSTLSLMLYYYFLDAFSMIFGVNRSRRAAARAIAENFAADFPRNINASWSMLDAIFAARIWRFDDDDDRCIATGSIAEDERPVLYSEASSTSLAAASLRRRRARHR